MNLLPGRSSIQYVVFVALATTAACSSQSGGAAPGGGDGGGGSDSSQATGGDGSGTVWVGTWANGPQLTETTNLPPAPGLTGNTLRQEVYLSIGGSQLRVRLSNLYGDGPVTMNSVHVAASLGAGAINTTTDTALAFSGAPSVTIAAGDAVMSDPLPFALAPLSKLAITIAFGSTPAGITGHPGSRTTSYLKAGNAVTAQSLAGSASTAHWYYITGVDVMADPTAGAIVAFGDSITDGRGSTNDANDRWPDDLSRRLQAGGAMPPVAVLNLGIGGNAVLSGGLGPTAVQRFASDALGQSGARWLILLEGVNDIGAATDQTVATGLITTFGQFIDMAHGQGLRAYGVPILPFGGSMYDSADHQTARTTVNTWIRTSGRFDAVIDLDPVVADPSNPTNLLAAYDSGDHLHPNPAGYQAMAAAIDLSLFGRMP
jgi:lysophospholipase L1-like esterase